MSNAAKIEELRKLAIAALVVDKGSAMELSEKLNNEGQAFGLPATQLTLALVLSLGASAQALGEIGDMYPLRKSELTVLPHVVALLRTAADIFEAVEAGALSDG